jgi:hypothetical protein
MKNKNFGIQLSPSQAKMIIGGNGGDTCTVTKQCADGGTVSCTGMANPPQGGEGCQGHQGTGVSFVTCYNANGTWSQVQTCTAPGGGQTGWEAYLV